MDIETYNALNKYVEMDLRQTLVEIDKKITDLQTQIFTLTAMKKKYEKQKREIDKLTGKVDEILNQ